MRVMFFLTTPEGAMPLGDFVLSKDGTDVDIVAEDEHLEMMEEMLEKPMDDIYVEDDPAEWLQALAEHYGHGSMAYAILDEDYEEPEGATADAAYQPDPEKVERARQSYNAMKSLYKK